MKNQRRGGFAFLFLGLVVFLMSSFRINGGVIGTVYSFSFVSLIGLVFLIGGLIVLVVGKDSLEAIVVPTGPSLKIDHERAVAGARKYHQNENRYMIISGVYNRGRYSGSQSKKIHETLVEEGVPEERIFMEHESEDTMGNVLYMSKLAEKKKIKRLIIATDKSHAVRFKLLFDRAKKKGLVPKYLKVRFTTRGLEPSYSPFKAKLAYANDSVRPMKDVG